MRLNCSRYTLVAMLVSLVFCVAVSYAGSDATVTGLITDQSGAAVPGATVVFTNINTNVPYTAQTNSVGIYSLPALLPGVYRANVSKDGFKNIVKGDIELHVQDQLSINFELHVGSVSESITVEGGAPLINESAAVSTVVDRQFVENIPLNGRSFQTLLTLTPGIVLTATNVTEQGQFSVNGQRADANYFTVDGVSSNVGISAGPLNQTAGGAIPALSALGGTNSLISVDAMQEFRIQTSTYAPEFGRTPGGQVSIVSRSGTNQFHGALFEYLRNDVLDANNWFNTSVTPALAKPKDRQNDFGGVVGGPIIRDRTFFFFSYEGLRLRQPLSATGVVPSTASRQTAQTTIPQILPYLKAYPVPNGPDLGNGFAQFSASFSNPATLNAYSLRVDHTINSKLALFGRWSDSPSETVQRGSSGGALSSVTPTQVNTQTFTLGLVQNVSHRISNDFRANYSNSRNDTRTSGDNFGGAVPLTDALIFPAGVTSENGLLLFNIIGATPLLQGKNVVNEQRQINLVDNLSVITGSHQLKFGIDYRWLAPFSSNRAYDQIVAFLGMNGPRGALSGLPLADSVSARQSTAFLVRNISLYGQDTWKMNPRLALSYGLRWDINPPLKGKDPASEPFTVQGLSNPATMSLAPRGTPLYGTTYGNVAPRVGIAYQVRQTPGREVVIRGGFGVFFDLGSGSLGNANATFPFFATKNLGSVPFPLTPQQAAPPPLSVAPPVGGGLFVADPGLKLPRTYQWNVAAEQSLGRNQAVSLTYVGAVGRDLLRQDSLFNPNANFQLVFVTRNTATSDYHALQIKYERRLSRGLQALLSYSFAHSIDIASNDSGTLTTPAGVASQNVDRGNSDFDIRHSFSAAITYDLPGPKKHGVANAILGHWSMDSFVIARSAPPVNLAGSNVIVAGTIFTPRPNVIPGIPLYLFGPQYAGGKILNNTPNQGGTGCKGPFCPAAAGQQGSLGRNVLRGFGAWQTDFALRRQFRLTEKIEMQFRTEFFNIFNHPNFGLPTNTLSSPLFGQSTQTLASSLGSGGANGGFNPLYQIGGPRSIQFALKLTF